MSTMSGLDIDLRNALDAFYEAQCLKDEYIVGYDEELAYRGKRLADAVARSLGIKEA